MLRYLCLSLFLGILFLFSSNIIFNTKNLSRMISNEHEFRAIDLINYQPLREAVGSLSSGFGVILLNQYALEITLNWLCNVAEMDVAEKILFFVVDEKSRIGLLRRYPGLIVVKWEAPSLQKTFVPFDSTYMSFFLMRTNLIKALQVFGKEFWMLQADTIWTENLLLLNLTTNAEILLDQQGYVDTAESRKRMMNGANFRLSTSSESRKLVDRWYDWQKWIYITDPDVVKILCLRGDFSCDYIDHKIISGWEWIYGDQANPPKLIQMDGETGGNKEQVLKKYGFWFLDENHKCLGEKVHNAIQRVRESKVPKVLTASKTRQQWILKIGEILNEIPIFGHFSSIYGGVASLYVQIF